jgi:hypothetical protein
LSYLLDNAQIAAIWTLSSGRIVSRRSEKSAGGFLWRKRGVFKLAQLYPFGYSAPLNLARSNMAEEFEGKEFHESQYCSVLPVRAMHSTALLERGIRIVCTMLAPCCARMSAAIWLSAIAVIPPAAQTPHLDPIEYADRGIFGRGQ